MRTPFPADLRGATVLDVGCNGGFYSIEMKRRGADRVLGIDPDSGYLAQARFAAEVCGVDVEFRQMSVYRVAQLREKFDWVLFMGVFYHLRHPLLALDLLQHHVVKDSLAVSIDAARRRGGGVAGTGLSIFENAIFDRPGFPKMHFIEHNYSGDPTNWWIPNRACVEALLRTAGFEIVGRPEPEIFLCKRRSEELSRG